MSVPFDKEAVRPRKQLSISKCRQILKQPSMSDEDVEQVRDTLYCFANLCIDSYLLEHPSTSVPTQND
tara:strand:- start:1616 stop:1819 length:204 start_codon:yes stop_codon:yes gene_type:complete